MTTRGKTIAVLTAAAAAAGILFLSGQAAAECIQGDCTDGRGVYQWPDGTRYEGEFKEGEFSGAGTYFWSDGKKYVGEFRNNKRNGTGTYSWPNGSRYSGQWKDGTRHGRGTFTWANGSRYEGEWYDGQKRGLGIYTFPDGSREAGRWTAGELIEPMDPVGVSARLAESAAPAPLQTASPQPDQPAAIPPPPKAQPEPVAAPAAETIAGERDPPVPAAATAAAETAVAPAPGKADPELPEAFALAATKIPLVSGGRVLSVDRIPLNPRGDARPVATCSLQLDPGQARDGRAAIRLSVQNLTSCRFSVEAYLRQEDTYIRAVSWTDDDAIAPGETQTAEETVLTPRPPLSSDLILKVQGTFQGCTNP